MDPFIILHSHFMGEEMRESYMSYKNGTPILSMYNKS